MYERLSKKMDQIIRIAQRVARDFEQDYVGTEHLLLAVLEEGTNPGAAILKEKGVDLPKARAAVDRLVKKSMEETWVFGRLPGTPHFKNVMATAIEEARQLESKILSADFLLLALAKEEGSVGCAALQDLGLSPGVIRAAIIRNLEHPRPDSDSPGNSH